MKNQKGMALLLEMLVIVAILSLFLATLVPSGIRAIQAQNENSAAGQLAQLSAAEFSMMQLYGIAVPPTELTGTLAQPINCANPMLASGVQVISPKGYSLTFTPGASITPTVSSCGTVTGAVSTYSINLDPLNALGGIRHFYTDQTQVIRFNDTHTAGPSDPVYPVATPTQGTVSTILTANNSTTVPPPPPPSQPVGSGQPGGTYTVSALFYGGGSVIASMDGTITIDPSSGNITSAQLGNCAANGSMVSGSNQDTFTLQPGGGCSWGGSSFTGQASFQNQDYNFTYTAPQSCGGCGQSIAITGTQQ